MSMQAAAKSNSKLTDFDDFREMVVDHISKVRNLPKENKTIKKENHTLNKFR